ncbi:MAG TPA: LysM peptidoglycan-binding domain-containing protein [Edaphobacter sp.]|jgi:nucleoid-associated protein YgaU|nr:LysM peptidoglycan-binding domain-containing protein [Edaphobacter sp.]
MADLEALKQKYAPVIQSLQRFAPYGATLEAVDLAGEQLHIRGTVPSKVVLERVWDNIKKVDPTYSDLKHEIGNVGGDTQPVTIKSGDTLSAISLLFYGNANKYPQIAKANNIADPNSVPIGTTLQLPVLN